MITDYPIDLASIKYIGIERWLSSNIPPNPVINLYQSIYKPIFSQYWNTCPTFNQNQEYYFTFAVNYKIVNSLADRIIKYLLYQKLKSLGYKRIIAKNNQNLEIDKAIENLISLENEKLNNYSINRSYLKEALIQFRLQWLFCKRFSFFPFHISSSNIPKYAVLGDINRREFQLLIKNQVVNSLFPFLPQTLIPSENRRVSQNDNKILSELLQSFFEELSKLFSEEKVLFNEKLLHFYQTHFLHTFNLIKSTQKKLNKLSENELFVLPHGNYFYRIVASAWKLAGGITSSFTHGYSFWFPPIDYSDWSNGAYAIYDKIFVFAKNEIQILEQNKVSIHPKMYAPSTYLLRGAYNNFINKLSTKTSVAKIKKVLYLGFPMDYINSYSVTMCNTLIQLKLELLTLKSLKKHNFFVTYKAHPDTKEETENFFDDFCDSVIVEPFEQIYHKYDCIIFGSIFSSTFGYSLLTNKHIVAFNFFDQYIWGKELVHKIKNRVSLVSLTIDREGNPIFNEDELIETINSSNYKVNNKDFFLELLA